MPYKLCGTKLFSNKNAKSNLQLIRLSSNIYIYIYIYIYSLKESEDGQLLTIKKLKNLIKNKNVSVLDLHQLHEKLNLSNLPK